MRPLPDVRAWRVLALAAAALLMAACATRTVVQERVVVVRDTVRVAVPYIPEKDYPPTWAGQTVRLLDSLCATPLLDESQLGLCVFDLTAGTELYEHGKRQRLRPASTMKVVTAVTAMTALADHPDAFAMRCYREPQAKGPANLTLVGGMDPLLDYGGLLALADSLLAAGISEVGDVRLDVSLADTTRWGEGWCWDDENEAMTPFLYKSAGAARGGRGSSRLAWRQRPEAPFIADLRKALKARKIAVKGRIMCDMSVCMATRPAADGAALVARIAHPWDEVLIPMMKDSDNQFAEAMLRQLGLLCAAPNPSLGRIVAPFDSLCAMYGLDRANYRIADGSGRSLYNYVTPELLCVLLNHAALQPWYGRFRAALPVMGADGTLRKRCHGTTAQGRVFAKTGTVTGVASLAGYAVSSHDHLLCFAIINQGVRAGSLGRAFQDEVCKILTR